MYWNLPNLPNRSILSITNLRLMSARNYDSGLIYYESDEEDN